MEMEAGEICRRYREAKDRPGQVQILAELNRASRAEIIRILLDGHEDVRVSVGNRAWAQVGKMTHAQYKGALQRRLDALDAKIERLREERKELSMVMESLQGKG